MIYLKMFDRAFGARIFLKDSIKKSCAFGARILSNYSTSYGFIYQYQIFLYHHPSLFMEKNQGQTGNKILLETGHPCYAS